MSEPEAPSAASPPPPPPPPEEPDHQLPERLLMLVLAYLGILALVPYFMVKDDPEVQWHAKHGLVLTALWLVVFIPLGMFGLVLNLLTAFLGCAWSVLLMLLAVGVLAFHAACVVKAMGGERLKIPRVSDVADRF